jgi:hypothetical protein
MGKAANARPPPSADNDAEKEERRRILLYAVCVDATPRASRFFAKFFKIRPKRAKISPSAARSALEKRLN